MNILVFLKQVDDVRVSLGYDESTGSVKKDWNVPMLDPHDRSAVEAALDLKARFPETRVRAVHLGPRPEEGLLRDALSFGCDEGFRVWEDGLDDLHVLGKTLILAGVARVLTFDLLFLGARSQDTGSCQLGILVASSMGIPCLSHVTALRVEGTRSITATRRRAWGYEELVAAALPLVVTMEASEDCGRYASLPALISAYEREIPCLSLPEIGIPLHLVREVESRLSFGRLRFPSSRMKPIAAPDSFLPAFERREHLREGSMKRRAGTIVRGEADDVAEELFQALLQGGWLDHLRKKRT